MARCLLHLQAQTFTTDNWFLNFEQTLIDRNRSFQKPASSLMISIIRAGQFHALLSLYCLYTYFKVLTFLENSIFLLNNVFKDKKTINSYPIKFFLNKNTQMESRHRYIMYSSILG